MSLKKWNKKLIVLLCCVVFIVLAVCFIIPLRVEAEEESEIEYIYLDLRAGNVTVTGNAVTGYRYDGSDTPQEITATITDTNQHVYVYQSSDDDINTGLIDGVVTLPEHSPIICGVKPWREYITNNTVVENVINEWRTAAAKYGRTPTDNYISVTGEVDLTLVIDNIWSSYYEKGSGGAVKNTSKKSGGITFYPAKTDSPAKSKLTVSAKGENRFTNIYYLSDDEKKYSLVFEEYQSGSSITVADNLVEQCSNYWCAAIGADDGGSGSSKGIVINGGTIFAGTTAADDCTAIGGGNGYGHVTINGGTVTAVVTSSGAAIGGGIGKTSTGGAATVNITGGNVYAYNNSCSAMNYSNMVEKVGYIPAAAIGGGSSAQATCSKCYVNISGGYVYAQSVGGTAIGGGSSADTTGGSAVINITGGTVNVKSIAGTIYNKELNKTYDVPAGVAIGGGTGGKGPNGNGGSVELTISGDSTVLTTGSIGGGGTINEDNKIGNAVININGGTISGQFIMAGGAANPCSLTMTGGTVNNGSRDNSYIFLEDCGGAIYMDDPSGVATVSGGNITNCSAVDGGAVYMTAGTFTLSGGTITKCSATGNGGGVYLGGGKMTVTSGSLTENTAQNGGAAYVSAAEEDDGVFVSGGVISANTATTGNGGGILVNNGFYKMTGGNVDNNTARDGYGGGIFVAADGRDVTVDLWSGSISNNKAGQSGGAVSVIGQKDGTENITVTVGVNELHFDDGGNPVCDHDCDSSNASVVTACPVLNGNYATVSGGGIYITGGKTTELNTYCLIEEGSTAADGKSKSNFMMVEGGTVVFSTAENKVGNNDDYGNIVIKNSVYINAGDMALYGSMSNPIFYDPITVDVTTESGSYADYRTSDGSYYKLQYYENFTDPVTKISTGQYTVFQIKHGESHEILPALY